MNWRSEAAEVLRAYHARRASVQSMALEISRLGMNSSSGDDRLNQMVMKAALTQSCRETQLWLQAVENALEALTEQERRLLTDLFICPKWGNVKQLQEQTGYTRSTLYRKRDMVLRKFALAMYGKD